MAGRLGSERRVFSALRTGAEEAAVAPGAFERAHPSPRANADPGPTAGTAPDSPRAFLAAMEDGVYGRSGRGGTGCEQMERFPPRAFRHEHPFPARVARSPSAPSSPRFCATQDRLPAGPESGAFRAIVWAEPVSGGGGRGRDGGEAGAEPFPPEGPGEPSAAGGRGRGLRYRVPLPNSSKRTSASSAIVTSRGPRRPDAQGLSYLLSNGARKPRPQPPSK